jgi:amidohydrolase
MEKKMSIDIEQLKQIVSTEVDRLQDRLITIAKALYDDPEISFEEHRSMALLAGIAEEAGFEVERQVGGLATAYKAIYRGNGQGSAVGFLAEYDALPELGHACGHNFIAASSTGAALALRPVMEQLPGRIMIVGTPAEEKGGGKVTMIEHNAFDDVDMVMMVHPANKTLAVRGSLASTALELEFFGQAAHAAVAPERGINALDACIQTFNNINALRQHLPKTVRIHGIITHGGVAPNIVPEYAAARFSVRGVDSEESLRVADKLLDCGQAAAQAMGATFSGKKLYHYANMVYNRTMANVFAGELIRLGETVYEPAPDQRMGSTDAGNLSQFVPSIHPYLAIVDENVSGHTPEFREAVMSERGQAGLIKATKAMALTTIELLARPELAAQVRHEFDVADKPWRKLSSFGFNGNL